MQHDGCISRECFFRIPDKASGNPRSHLEESAHPKGGKTLAFVTGMIPCRLARGRLADGLALTVAMTAGMIATISWIVLATAFARFIAVLDRPRT